MLLFLLKYKFKTKKSAYAVAYTDYKYFSLQDDLRLFF